MSDLQDLIHRNAQLAFEQGVKTERERIIKLLEDPLHHNIQSPDIHKDCYTCVLVALIKGEQ